MERSKRIDSDFYSKENQNLLAILNKMELGSFESFFSVSDGNHMSISDYFTEKGIPYYRGQDIYEVAIENSSPLYISKEAFDSPYMKRSHLKKGDVLLSIFGAIIGNTSIVTSDAEATCSCKLAILRTKNKGLSPEMLEIYIKTQYGQNQIQKFRRGSTQTGLLLEDFDQLYIPKFHLEVQHEIENLFSIYQSVFSKTISLYQSAENLLLSHLGLLDFAPKEETVAVKSFSESFLQSGRLDAEYYQPKYDELMKHICVLKHKTVGKLVTIKKSIEPGSDYYGDEGIPFVRVSNLTKFGISPPDIKLPLDIVKNVKSLFPKEDTVLLSKDGSVGIAYKTTENIECVTSGAILHLTVNNSDELLPDYLTLVLNSPIVQLQAERDAGGSIIQHWKPSEIEQVVIPLLDISIQKEIAEKVQESFTLRKQSEQLLETAKQAVEMAIEQDEKTALAWLEKSTV